ncbi:MAG TPA: bifunctional diguanylate cyclase/phosphodiesterase [Steroidobacteraceae bacterium]|nr:bifunctional diguanylate cyclase/phosphodiesterase [Steroidobacteraceae bacterium]
MMPAFVKRAPSWLPTVLVLLIVLGAGARLTVLSLEERAEHARVAAQAIAVRCARALELQLQALAQRAAQEATHTAAHLTPGAPLASAGSPGRDAFWLTTDGAIVTARGVSPAIAHAIATEWHPTQTGGALTSGMFGPLREGSQWLLAARSPIVPAAPEEAATDSATGAAGWAVAFASLDRLLASSQLGRVAGSGYDFALVQPAATVDRSRTFVASNSEPLQNPATSLIRAPAGFAFAPPGGNLQIEIRPHSGWYPTSIIATDIGLLAVIAWLLAFTAHDLTHRTQRLKAALLTVRRQLHEANQRLMREIEQRQTLQKSFDHARYHDAFTGLPNRRYFMDQLDRAVRELRTQHRRRIGVVLIDVDRFRLINDTLGHTAGDELMMQISRRFQKTAADTECVLARWGGDQFALLILDAKSGDAVLALTDAMQESLREPFEVRRHLISITARMGFTCVEPGARRAEDVLREADIALGVAKRNQKAKCIAYTPNMGGHAASLVSLEADLHLALERNELKLLFQPIVDLRGRRMVGAEVLLRWRHPVEGLLRPDRFLPIAEEVGLIVPITRWVVRRVCRLASEWRRRLPPDVDFYFSINLSATALRDPDLINYVSNLLEETHAPARALKFELTEGGLISNVGATRDTLEQLHNIGIQLMLDDFGTGYSSLNYLQLFPFDYVKIDRPLLATEGPERRDGLVSAMVQLASSIGLTPIAEVVETQAAADALQEMGCNFGQGYFFSAPVEAEEALQCLRGELDGKPPQREEVEPEEEWTDDSPTLILPVAMIPESGEES